MTSQDIPPLSSSQEYPGLGDRLYMRCYAGNYLSNRKLKSKYSYLKTDPSPIPFISITPNYLSQSTKKLKSSKENKNKIPTSIKKELDDIFIINKYTHPAKPLNELIDYSNKLYNYSKKYQIDKEKNEKKYYEQFSYRPATNSNNQKKSMKNFYVRLEGWNNKIKMKNNNNNKNNIIDEKTGQVLFKPKINKSNKDNNNNKNVFENLYRIGMNSKIKRKNDEEKYYNKIKKDSNKKFFNKEDLIYIENSQKKKIFEKIFEVFHKYKNDSKLINEKIDNNNENEINDDENKLKKYFIDINDDLCFKLNEFYKSIEDDVNKEKFFELSDKMYNTLNDNLKKEFLKIKVCN